VSAINKVVVNEHEPPRATIILAATAIAKKKMAPRMSFAADRRIALRRTSGRPAVTPPIVSATATCQCAEMVDNAILTLVGV